ncbi:hypothetical protein RD110_08010 [Rhodoferax koreense]|uniref:Uncharacterized protein n=2 Tax=Rhodoferax koreensis TaxID=1842727 RepID=A0A1P8JTU4_9BURK|nr:hypothetical protein RD110_08010 [Rhodoferax koreense]
MSTFNLTPTPAPTANTGGPWVLLWSHSQNAFHIESFAEMLSSNRRAYSDDRAMDYVPLYAGRKDECHKISSAVRSTMIKRAEERVAGGRLTR